MNLCNQTLKCIHFLLSILRICSSRCFVSRSKKLRKTCFHITCWPKYFNPSRLTFHSIKSWKCSFLPPQILTTKQETEVSRRSGIIPKSRLLHVGFCRYSKRDKNQLKQAESSPKILKLTIQKVARSMSKIKKKQPFRIMNTSHLKVYTELKPTGSAASLFCFLERIPGLKATSCKVLQKLRVGSDSFHYKTLKNLLQNLLIQFSQIRNFRSRSNIPFQVLIQLLKTRV